MKVGQQADHMTLFVDTVESIQRAFKNAPNEAALAQQIAAEGLDPELVEGVSEQLRKYRKIERDNFLQRVSSKEVSDALFGFLMQAKEPKGATDRGMLWALSRQKLQDFGKPLGDACSDLHDAIAELGGWFPTGGLTPIGRAFLALFVAIYESRLSFKPNLQQLSEEIASWLKQSEGKESQELESAVSQRANKEVGQDPWKASLAAAYARSEKGKRGVAPTDADLAEQLLDDVIFDALVYTTEGPWVTLLTQAMAVQAQNRVGRALEETGNIVETIND
ncbi:hypothetical protein ACFL6C_07835 [Myxococcota bacterium]